MISREVPGCAFFLLIDVFERSGWEDSGLVSPSSIGEWLFESASAFAYLRPLLKILRLTFDAALPFIDLYSIMSPSR